jgi:hypothetical protein
MPYPPGYKRKEWNARLKELEPEICRRYQEGECAAALERDLGISDSTIRNVLVRNGVPVNRYYNGNARGLYGPLARNWKGGRYVDPHGYVRVLVGRDDPMRVMAFNRPWSRPVVMEHRLVMARHLGRPLHRAETVHHINGVRDDNRIENLQLRSGRHGTGAAWQCADCGSHNIVPTTLLDPV